MGNSIDTVGSSLEALNAYYQLITENLAYASTSGFKRRLETFIQTGAAQEGSSDGSGGGGGVSKTQKTDIHQGALRETGPALDLAINGGGFFVIETPNGVFYTRHGGFQLNSDRQLVDSTGQTVAGENGPITIPPDVSPTQISVSLEGNVSAGGSVVGTLRIVDFENLQDLKRVGVTHFEVPPGVDPIPAKSFSVSQKYQESSNVNIVRELVNLIMVTRVYQANLKSVQVQDERMKNLLQVALA